MAKHLCIVLGNGFSIDFLSHLKIDDKIDVQNLFRYGAEVPWPATREPGFLSFKHCPNLWNLGARPHCQTTECMSLIEDIITCVNAYASKKRSNVPTPLGPGKPSDIYIHAYKELSIYLRHLFIWYNNRISVIPDNISEWSWAKFISWANRSSECDRITIVTYNYDVWLERIFKKLNIDFQLGLVEPTDPNIKITILKPHGSISFCHKHMLDRFAFNIQPNRDLGDGDITDFSIKYDSLDENYLVNPIIPPAGESGRINPSWANTIREECRRIAESLQGTDEMLICGLSYWHVDRAELDEILNSCESSLNLRLINPKPNRTLIAVLTSIFDNFIAFTSTHALEQYII